MFTSTDNSIATQRHSQPPLPPRPKTTLQESRQPSMQTFAGWSAVAVGGTATLMGSLFFLCSSRPPYVSVPSDASQAIQAQVANNQEAKRNVAYALWASGATLTVAGLVQLFNQDDTE